MTESSKRIKRLLGVLFAIAAIGLVAAYIGIQSARDLILSRITINSAQQWAEILSFSASDPAKSYETEILTSRASERFAQAITDGLIVWYRVYDPDGKIALSSNQDGLELLQGIREGRNPGLVRDTRFIMLTSHSEKEVVQTALALDVDGYVIKPISPGGLVQTIERAFARKRILKAGSDYAAVELPKAG
jgi:DNA-binding NarL/FixJ family response regulator